jgi:LmbE family N-acetylglucosaminyl deacetylase
VDAYGKPNSSTLIAGSLASPLELLLFYDKGAHKSAPATLATQPAQAQVSTVLPITSDQLPYLTCQGPTDMNIVAHQDDDLLFMNPDIMHSVSEGHCIRTVYVTAGDAGGDSFYWLGREKGAEAAYSKMIGSDAVWIERIVQLGDNRFVTVANPKGNSKISLIFLHLPDGSPSGKGFKSSHDESLDKLETGKIPLLHTVDRQSHYTADELTGSLVDLMRLYQPAMVRAQSSHTGKNFVDHSDHNAVGRFAKKAHDTYVQQQFEGKVQIPMTFYLGYPVHDSPENITGADLQQKTAIFFAYAAYDGGVCHTQQQCDGKAAVYGLYLRRQYMYQN